MPYPGFQQDAQKVAALAKHHLQNGGIVPEDGYYFLKMYDSEDEVPIRPDEPAPMRHFRRVLDEAGIFISKGLASKVRQAHIVCRMRRSPTPRFDGRGFNEPAETGPITWGLLARVTVEREGLQHIIDREIERQRQRAARINEQEMWGRGGR